MSKKGEDSPVSLRECLAYREAIKAEIKGVRDTIIVGLSVSTAIITLIMYALQVVMK